MLRAKIGNSSQKSVTNFGVKYKKSKKIFYKKKIAYKTNNAGMGGKMIRSVNGNEETMNGGNWRNKLPISNAIFNLVQVDCRNGIRGTHLLGFQM